jgi:hypothetical protein
MAFIRFAAVLSLVLAVGCEPEPPSPETLSQELLKKLIPSVSTAKNVTIVASSPTSSETSTDFAVKIADALSKKIASGGLAPDTQPKVRVLHTPEDVNADALTDVTLYFQVDDYKLEGEFDTDRVVITKTFKADVWIYSRDNDSPFTMNSGFSTSEKATGPETDVTSSPTWESFGYSSDPDERSQIFAGKCADSILKTFHELSSQLGQSK